MAGLAERLEADFRTAMKSQSPTLGLLRMLRSVVKNSEIEKKAPLNDEEVLDVLLKEAKKRKDAKKMYDEANRPELAATEESELKIMEEYLPKPASMEEIQEAVNVEMAKVPGATQKDFGRIMGPLSKQFKGRVEPEVLMTAIRAKLV
jgi:uncharacterized protein YqeY